MGGEGVELEQSFKNPAERVGLPGTIGKGRGGLEQRGLDGLEQDVDRF